ncbi:substrate-binding domain-containing protein [Pseudomonas syringae]|nr:substrate-binding domain-containing protein [Pseudomonas syringae]MDF5835212.1 substrate-binding domain-containing protein [Pseudomonas syringae]UZS66253.1 substrate-binding domain-containing protein [Pseudomonas syringae]
MAFPDEELPAVRLLFKPFMLSCALLSSSMIHAADAPETLPVTLKVLSSNGFKGAIQAIAPEYEKVSGVKLDVTVAQASGPTPEAIASRLDRKEDADVVLTMGSSLDTLTARNQVEKSTRVDLGQSFIAMAVRKGAPQPDIGSMKAFRTTLLEADSIAYSDSASGIYLSHWLFPNLHLQPLFFLKSKVVGSEPVGNVVARGEAELGFQQLSVLKPVKGIDIVGLIPDNVQQMVLYSGAVVKNSAHPNQAKALLDYMASDKGRRAIELSGLKPMH